MPRSDFHNLTQEIEKRFGIRFRRRRLLEASLIHPSFRNEKNLTDLEDFDRLEFFGDAILNYVICRRLFDLFPEADEGILSRLRSILVSRKIISRVAKQSGIDKIFRMSKSLQELPFILKMKVLTDLYESFLAALFFEKGLAQTEKFILLHFTPFLDSRKLLRLDPNPKSTLQELSQKHWRRLPTYRTEPVRHGVKAVVTLSTRRKASATGRTRQEAEEKAARSLIQKIRQELATSRLAKKSSGKK